VLTTTPRLPSQARIEPFVVELERFQGPLDLLLHLIRAQDIDIFDIPIARITEQFQALLAAGLQRVDLDRAGEFLELAATLVRIKAQLLLPRHGDLEWEEDPRADLVRRLLEYEFFQEISHVLSNAEADRSRHFDKGFVLPRSLPTVSRDSLDLTLHEFLDVALLVPEPVAVQPHIAPIQLVTVEEKIALLRRRLETVRRLPFRKMFSSWKARDHVVASLLACLELAKQQILRIEQATQFGTIWLFSRDETARERRTDEEAEVVARAAETDGSNDGEAIA
jgi:segregation and condensation protein A